MIKTAADVLTEQIIINMNSGNAVISVFVMELNCWIFGWRDGVSYYFVAVKLYLFHGKLMCMGDHSRRFGVYGMIYHYLSETDCC